MDQAGQDLRENAVVVNQACQGLRNMQLLWTRRAKVYEKMQLLWTRRAKIYEKIQMRWTGIPAGILAGMLLPAPGVLPHTRGREEQYFD